MMTRVDERSPETSMTEIVVGPCAAGCPDGSMAIHVSGSASATAGTRARLMEPPLGKHPVGTRTPGRCPGARVEAAEPLAGALPLELVRGEAHEPPPLPPLDRCRWGVPPARLAALHLDEHPGAAVTADQVELAEGEPHVALDDDEARAREEARRRVLRVSTTGVSSIGHARQ